MLSAAPAALTIFGMIANGGVNVNQSKVVRVSVSIKDHFALTLTLPLTLSLFFLRIHEVDGVAFVTGLGARMSLVAMVTNFHARPVRSRREGIVFNIAMAIDTQRLSLTMKFMGNLHNPDILQVRLFSPGNGRMAAKTALVHQVITGRKLEQKDLSGFRVAIPASHSYRMDAGRKPPLLRILIFMTTQAEKRVGRGEAH